MKGQMMTSLKGKLILVTGASRGLGRATALACAKAGAELIISARTLAGLEELDDEITSIGGQATIVEMDALDFEAVPRLAAAIQQKWGRLDGFVANAGQLGQLAPLPHIEADIFDRTIQVNLTSIWHQIRSFDGLLRAAPAGRSVLVSSGAAHGARAYWGAYAISKAGLEAMANIYADETTITSVKVNIYDPGGTRTAMRAKAVPGEDASVLPAPVDHWDNLSKLLSASYDGTRGIIRFKD